MNLSIYILSISIFAMTTSEFMVAGMLDSIAQSLNVNIPSVGFLVSVFAASIVIGGPILTVLLCNVRQKSALLFLMVLFFFSQIIGAISNDYLTMLISRILGGISESAFFGLAISIAMGMVSKNEQGRAASIVLAGIMFASVLGLPLASQVDQNLSWRYSFWGVAMLTLICTVIIAFVIPSSPSQSKISISNELKSLKNGQLWAAYLTSGLIIGAVFSAFTYFSPIFLEAVHIQKSILPLVFFLYGGATIIGNYIVGRLADRYAMQIMGIGLCVMIFTLTTMAISINDVYISILCAIFIGLFGVSMNPAMVTRVMRCSTNSALVNSLHMSVINLGIVVGSWLGGFTIEHNFGLTSPLWCGVLIATAGLLSLLPYINKYKNLELKIDK